MARALPRVKLVYLMRHPIDRLLSQYIHERSVETVSTGIEEAVDLHPELVSYSRYATQLQPYFDVYGQENVLPVFFNRLTRYPQEELERICRFVGYPKRPSWDHGLKPQNVGSERLRKSAVRDVLVRSTVLGAIRKRLVPKPWTEPVKALWRFRAERPELAPELEKRLSAVFDDDLALLGSWLGVELNCANFSDVVEHTPLDWSVARRRWRSEPR
jgi:hypothetical protein